MAQNDETRNALEAAIERLNARKKTSETYPEITLVRMLLGEVLERMEIQLGNPEAHSPEEINLWWGKDSVVSVLTKATQILSKTIPLEQDNQLDEVLPGFTDEDKAILQRFIERCGGTYGE